MDGNPYQKIEPIIDGNPNLRTPQKETYAHLAAFSEEGSKEREVGIVLPVGCGKSGCITLAPFALFEMAKAIQANPEAEFFYSDEDKLDAGGERVEPNFKPDWSPETLRSRNYICHFTVLKKSILTELNGIRSGFDGAAA